MTQTRNYLPSVVSALSLLLLGGCGLTLGPQVKTEVVLVKPGQPVKVTENRTLRGEALADRTTVLVDVGGWVAMPQEHWDAVQRALCAHSAESAKISADSAKISEKIAPPRGNGD